MAVLSSLKGSNREYNVIDKSLKSTQNPRVKIDSFELEELMIEIANERFGSSRFKRRQLMNATEEVVRERGFWTLEDDRPSKSFGFKSRGLALIDFRFSNLKRRGRLVNEGRDKWHLSLSRHSTIAEPLLPSDIVSPPDRIEAHVARIIRDTAASKSLKILYDYKCQICGLRIEPKPGRYYIEVHHVRPLGGGHSGLDLHANMLVLCPNHHAMFDFGIPRFIAVDQISINGESYNLLCKHSLTSEVVTYHNEHIHRRTV